MPELSTQSMRGLDLISVRPLVKGTLLGFVTFSYGHLTVLDAPLLRSGDRIWIGLPGKPKINRDGSPMLDDRGKALYQPVNAWTTKASGDRVQQQLIEQIRVRFPDALGGSQ